MTIHLRLVLLIAIIIYFLFLYHFLKRGQLIIKYTLLWFLLGLVMLIVIIFPQIILFITKICGIKEMVNGIFAIVCFGMLVILISLTAIVSKLNEKNKNLVQKVALLEQRLRLLEETEILE